MKNLPEEYCPACANERPQDFEFIRQAEEQGAIVFTAYCATHGLAALREALEPAGGKAWIEGTRLVAALGKRKMVSRDCVPASGVRYAVEGRAS